MSAAPCSVFYSAGWYFNLFTIRSILLFGIFSSAFAVGLEKVGRLDASRGLPGAEISAYVPDQKILVTTSGDNSVSVISLEEPSTPRILDILPFRGEVPSVAAYRDFLAVAETNIPETSPGWIHLFQVKDRKLVKVRTFSTGPQPDMVAFSPDGKTILVACEGEADMDVGVDPEGSVGFIDLSEGVENATSRELPFGAFDSLSLAGAGVRLAGPGSYLQNLEPEYIAFSPDGKSAFVSLQENNAVAKIDVAKREIEKIWGLGAVDHSQKGNAFDYRKDGKISLENAPVRGELQPDGVAAFEWGGKLYFLTADEGASRDDSFYSDETRAETLLRAGRLDKSVFTASLVRKLGKLPIDAENPCDGNEPCRYLNTFGGRSMSLFDGETGARIWNSGETIEKISAQKYPERFNANSKKKKAKPDARSEKKGPEPENVTVGTLRGVPYAFLGMERSSGIAIFRLENPETPQLEYYVETPEDRGPEGILFVSAEDSPLPGEPLLIVGYEYGESLVVYRIIY